jgi:hypothetical protein
VICDNCEGKGCLPTEAQDFGFVMKGCPKCDASGEVGNPADIFTAQLQNQSIGVVRVNDGHTFLFPLAVLEQLAEHARKTGHVMLFVKHGSTS